MVSKMVRDYLHCKECGLPLKSINFGGAWAECWHKCPFCGLENHFKDVDLFD